MCGVAFTSFDAGDLSGTMARRGPDGYARRAVPLGTLHHSRLRIQGNQQQPIVEGDVATVYNGEVYNAAELGAPDQDAALMARGFRAQGPAFMQRANGSWAFVQASPWAVTAVRDRFGLRPLFRYSDGQRLIYASNVAIIKTALDHVGQRLAVNDTYPAKGRVPLPCYYRGVVSLPPGTIEIAERREGRWCFDQARWYTPEPRSHGQLEAVLNAAVARRLHPDAVAAVSGGVDSFLLRAFADVPAFHLNVTGEAEAARRIGAAVLEPGLADLADVLTTLEQPFYASPPNYWLAQAIKNVAPSARVVLTGIGADELFGGYRHHAEPFTRERYLRVYGIQASRVGWRASELEHSIAHHYGYRTDQMFLRFGLEARHPYLDHEVVETALCQPHDNKEALKALACRLGWAPGDKRGFAADFSRFTRTERRARRHT